MSLPSTAQLKRALEIKEKIEALENELNQIFGTRSVGRPAGSGRKGGGISAAGRARIAAAQKARWARLKGKMAPAAKAGRRKMSPAARAKIAAAARARWQKAKSSGKNTL
jgi:hypothetical protein